MAADSAPDLGDKGAKQPYPWRKTLLTLGGTCAYMAVLFWLWSASGRPKSFGISITAHGRVGLFENWYYSYLLLGRPGLADYATFLYMWAPVVGFVAWLGWTLYAGWRDGKDMPS